MPTPIIPRRNHSVVIDFLFSCQFSGAGIRQSSRAR